MGLFILSDNFQQIHILSMGLCILYLWVYLCILYLWVYVCFIYGSIYNVSMSLMFTLSMGLTIYSIYGSIYFIYGSNYTLSMGLYTLFKGLTILYLWVYVLYTLSMGLKPFSAVLRSLEQTVTSWGAGHTKPKPKLKAINYPPYTALCNHDQIAFEDMSSWTALT